MSVVAAIAAASGWWVQTSRAQRQAIDAIASKGGFIWLDRAGDYVDIEFGVPQHQGCGQIIPLAGPHGKPTTFADEDLTLMNHIWRLRRVSLANTRIPAGCRTVSRVASAHKRNSVAEERSLPQSVLSRYLDPEVLGHVADRHLEPAGWVIGNLAGTRYRRSAPS
jgi:hypothetical protein